MAPKLSEKEEEDEFDVETILRKRKIKGKIFYFVKWLGYPESENLWIPRSELRRNCTELLEQFEKDLTMKTSKNIVQKAPVNPPPSLCIANKAWKKGAKNSRPKTKKPPVSNIENTNTEPAPIRMTPTNSRVLGELNSTPKIVVEVNDHVSTKILPKKSHETSSINSEKLMGYELIVNSFQLATSWFEQSYSEDRAQESKELYDITIGYFELLSKSYSFTSEQIKLLDSLRDQFMQSLKTWEFAFKNKKLRKRKLKSGHLK